MDLLLESSINESLNVFVYEGGKYKDSFTGKVEDSLVFLIPVSSSRTIVCSLNTLKNNKPKNYRQNSVVSPQDCRICGEKYRYGLPTAFYMIDSDVIDGTFPTVNNNHQQSNRSLSSTTNHSSITSSVDPLLHSIFDTKTKPTCKKCVKNILESIEELSSDPELIAKNI